MSKILQKILVILLIAIIFISYTSNIIKAAYEITEANIVQIGTAPQHLKYYNETKGMYTYAICHIVGYYDNGKFYPAYCLNRDLHGVGVVDSYSVDVDSVITNNKIWRAVKNGYPYKTPEEMGVYSEFDAFAVTKFAIYCLTGQADINLYTADEGDEEGKAMLEALHRLVDIGLNGAETYSQELEITQTGNLIEEGEYYSITYGVKSGATISKYSIKSISGLSEGDLLTDENGNIKTTFNSGENFKIKISKNNMNSNKNINIQIESELKNYPMFYGKTRISGTQDYLLTANSYKNIESNCNTKLKLDTAKIIINKKDDETKEPIKDCVFEIYNANNELIGTGTTDINGKIEIPNLYQGSYTLKEIKANDKYILEENKIFSISVNYNQTATIDIENKHKKGDLTIYKVDKDNNNIQLGNIEFELYSNETGKLIGTYYTDANGKIEIKDLRIGNYRLKETSTNKWYNLAENVELEIKWNETTETKVEDELKKSRIKVVKVDKDNNQIKIPNVKFEVLDINNNVLETIITDEQGEAVTSQYALRDFEKIRLREISTNEWYKINNEIMEVTLEENQTKTIIIENEKKKGQIKVIKKDLDNNEIKLQGVKFNILDESGNIVDTITTNENGEATSKMLPIDQKYMLQEIETKENYVLLEETKEITLSEDQISEIIIENEKKKGQIKVIKVDKDDNQIKIPNVEFNILDEEGNIVETIITNEQGEATTKRLPIDKNYILKETKTNEKYILSEETQTVTLTQDEIKEIIFENEKIKGTIQIKKVTAETSEITGIQGGMPLEGVTFEIYDYDGKLVDTISTNKEGTAISKKLEKGKYKVKEVATNEWYILDENYYVAEITTNNQVVTLTLKNEPAKPDEKIQKTGVDTAVKGEEIEYKINVENTGNVALNNFILEDEIPKDYITVTKIDLGTYNQENTYNLYYKTNLSDDYILLLEDISTKNSEQIDFSKELSDGEYVTHIKLDFGTVDVGFKSEKEISIYAKIKSSVKREDVFENKAILTSDYNEYKLNKESNWKTKVLELLPLTGI